MSADVDEVLIRHRLTVHDYHRMGEAGIFRETDRVELIEGEVIDMAPIGSDHYGTVNFLNYTLVRAVGDVAVVSVQNPVRLNEFNEPQPDFALLRPRGDYYRGVVIMPRDVFLLIEVANSSLNYDRRIKLPLYARHGIPEVWIVNLSQRLIEAHRDPGPDGYRGVSAHGVDDALAPTLLPDVRFDLRAILG